MGDGYNFRQLQAHILPRSQATEWEVVKKEWSLLSIYESEEDETCPCGHFPIREICRIRNHVTEVGNVCVKRFLGLNSHRIFAAIKKIRKDLSKSLNADAIAFFREKELLTPWEYSFLQDTLKKRALTLKQHLAREKINQKVLDAVANKGFQGPS